MFITTFNFGLLYTIFPNLLNTDSCEITKLDSDILNRFITGMYHSIVTFLTIGYGDIQPKSFLGVILSGTEGFLGLFLMAYFTIAFSRKVLR